MSSVVGSGSGPSTYTRKTSSKISVPDPYRFGSGIETKIFIRPVPFLHGSDPRPNGQKLLFFPAIPSFLGIQFRISIIFNFMKLTLCFRRASQQTQQVSFFLTKQIEYYSKIVNKHYFSEVGGSVTCSAMRISATCATRKIAADVRFDPQSTDCGIALAHLEIKLRTLLPLCTILF